MLTCLWAGGLGGPVGHLCDGVLTAIASLRPSALPWEIAKPPKWSPSCPLVPFLLLPRACPRSGPDKQMKSPGLPGTARCLIQAAAQTVPHKLPTPQALLWPVLPRTPCASALTDHSQVPNLIPRLECPLSRIHVPC